MNAPVFKSINLRDDLSHPSRFAHYHPTSRSLPLVRKVMEPGATMAIAAYGSGKSISAGIGALAVVNEPASKEVLLSTAGLAEAVDAQAAAAIRKRAESGAKGRAVVLSGYVRDPAAEISVALGLPTTSSMRRTVNAIRNIGDADRVAIVWDEFGRHLEGLLNEGRARELSVLQDLSELAVRPGGPVISLTLLLHQNLLAYAGNLNQSGRNEWRKVEGRFDHLRFIEDSRELYRLVAAVLAARMGERPPAPRFGKVAKAAAAARWFDGIPDERDTEALLEAAWPLTAGALQVLPRLVARVGQNERSLFSFLEQAELSRPIGLKETYDAFAEAIRSDVGVGGLHRRWIEAESAIGRTVSEVEAEIVAAAFLLQAGVSGERRRLGHGTLTAAAMSKGYGKKEISEAIDALVRRKLLLHRKLNDDVSVWHGADVDVRGRLEEERQALSPDFDVAAFLAREHLTGRQAGSGRRAR